MNNILYIIIFCITFKLNATSFTNPNCGLVNFYRIMLFNVALINKLNEQVFINEHQCKNKKYFRQKAVKSTSNQKALKSKKYCLMQPKSKNSTKTTKNKEKNTHNNNHIKQKVSPQKNKRNKLNRQMLYDKKNSWLSDLDCDNNTIIFSEKEITTEDEHDRIDRLIKQWLIEDQLQEDEDNRIGLFCFINEFCDEQNFLIEKYIANKNEL